MRIAENTSSRFLVRCLSASRSSSSRRRMTMAFGVKRLDELGERVTDVLEMTPPEGLVDKIRALGKLKSLADSRPKVVGSGPCQEVVVDPPSLDPLPIMTCWPGD